MADLSICVLHSHRGRHGVLPHTQATLYNVIIDHKRAHDLAKSERMRSKKKKTVESAEGHDAYWYNILPLCHLPLITFSKFVSTKEVRKCLKHATILVTPLVLDRFKKLLRQ